MASSENLASMEPWNFRPTFTDSWYTEVLARDAETLTRVLQKSLSEANTEALSSDMISPFLNFKPDATPTPTVSSLSGSDQETAPKRPKNTIPGATAKVSKRKSRASKKSQTTFITADPANFRQMVQQVTGVRLGNSQIPMTQILKPEPHRLSSSQLPVGGGCLPTLDTSAFLLDHHQQQAVGPTSAVVGPTSAAVGGISGPGPLAFAPSIGVVDPGLGSAGLGDLDTFSSFPTLESWKVM